MKGRHVQAGLLFVAICLLLGLGLAAYTMGGSDEADGNSIEALTNQATPIAVATPAVVEATSPDFLITDKLRANPPAWEDLGQGPNGNVFCEGAKGLLQNSSKRVLNLNVVVAESDFSSALGSVQPGQTLSFETGDVGTWNITDADSGDPLVQYQVKRCRNGEFVEDEAPADEEEQPAQVEASSMVEATCRVAIGGRRIMDGVCHFVGEPAGSFTVYDTTDGSGFSAQVDVQGGAATGSWNGERGGADASRPLGTVVRKGDCWTNSEAEICLRQE